MQKLGFACPGCGRRLKVKEELVGRKVKCPHCKAVGRVTQESIGARERVQPSEDVSSAATVPPEPQSLRETQNQIEPPKGATTAPYQPGSKDSEMYKFLGPPQAPDELGRLGPYRVLAVLGAGGMGVVFRALDPQLNRLVALKAMLPSIADAESGKARFLRESQAAAAIKHDHIVSVYQVGEDRGVPFLAMEFLEGEPLDKRLRRERKLPVVEVLRFGREIALGLAAAHKRGLIHRDIKPANLWVEAETGRIKVLDFGLARAAKEASPLTQPGAVVGTPEYMAPEQVQGKDLDDCCDLFSLGCVLYQMSTGQTPFKGTDIISTLMAVATENPRPPRDLEPGMPAALSKLILRLLAKEPGKRPESAKAVAEALQELEERTKDGPKTARPRTSEFAEERPPISRIMGMAGSLRSKKAKSRLGKKWHWPAIVAGILLAGILVAWAGGVFKVKTKNGTIVLDNLPAGAEVLVDGDMVTITSGADGKTMEISVAAAKKHQLQVKIDGFKVFGQEVEVDVGGRRPISVRLEPLPPPADGPVLAPGNLPDGKIPAFYSGIGKWRLEGSELILDSAENSGGWGLGMPHGLTTI